MRIQDSMLSVRVKQWELNLEIEASTSIHDRLVENAGQLLGWYWAFQQAYGHTPLFLKTVDASGDSAWLPSFIVNRPLFGTVITSMPFLDAAGPCTSSHELKGILVDELLARASEMEARLIELRCSTPLDTSVSPDLDKVTLTLKLPKDSGLLWNNLRAKVRNQVRKAKRSGLSVTTGGRENLDGFYAIYATNMRDLGSPAHSFHFFSSVLDAFKDRVQVVLVKKGRKTIGGLVSLSYNSTVVVPWASSLRQYLSLCPNMILYWETIKNACERGFDVFDFGRSSRNIGTYRFKRQWGTVEQQLYWYTIPVAGKHARKLSHSNPTGRALVSIWRHLPLAVSRWLGPKVRKYLTQ